MRRTRLALRLGCVVSTVLILAGCQGQPQSGQAQADAETRTACQARAEQADRQQNRGEIFSPPPSVNTPYSANYVPGMPGPGLSELFVHDRMVNDCIRNTGTGEDRNQPASPAQSRR